MSEQVTPRMDFSQALTLLKCGARVMRHGWNGKGMWLFLAEGGMFKFDGYVMGPLQPHIVMKTADNKFVPWLASQTDILATDWCECGGNFSKSASLIQPLGPS